MTWLRRCLVAIVATWLASPATAAAECLGADQLPSDAALAIPELGQVSGSTARGAGGRMIAPMMVNGAGPFRFIVDTGANRSALSHSLAERLGLSPVGTGDVHTIGGVFTAPFVDVRGFQYAGLHLDADRVPIVQGAVLGGEEGLLGVDSMRGRRLRMDFEHRCIEIGPSGTLMRTRGWTTIHGQLRFGHLVVVEGRINGERVNVIVDTGSDSTLANPALRERLRSVVRVDRRQTDYARAYTAGTPIVLDTAILIPRFAMGDVRIHNVTAYVGDFHIFRLWDFVEEPALLIGMDVLSQTRAIAIDYDRATVHFRLADPVRTGSRVGNRTGSGITIGQ